MDYKGVNVISNMPLKIEKAKIMQRLGYIKSKTLIGPHLNEIVESLIIEGFSYCRTLGIYQICEIKKAGNDNIKINDSFVLKSKSLYKLLSDSESIVFMMSTVGSAVMKIIQESMHEGNNVKAVVFDAVASETADSGLDYIMKLINTLIRPLSFKLTKYRYSPGYGDLSLQYQKNIYDYLKIENYDISITSKYMLIPEKTVLAIAGVERI